MTCDLSVHQLAHFATSNLAAATWHGGWKVKVREMKTATDRWFSALSPEGNFILECFSSPESALSFSFKVDNKLQRMRSAVHLRGKTCCSQIHLFDIIVLADPCPRPSEFLVLNISVAALPPLFSSSFLYKDMTGGPPSPPSGPQHPIKISVGTGAFVAVKSGKFRHKMSHYHPLYSQIQEKVGKLWRKKFFLRGLRRCQWLCAEITTVGIRGWGEIIRVW